MERHYALDLELEETIDETVATARMTLYGERFESRGEARRNPVDPPLPAVGEELAVSRALAGLSQQLMDAAYDKLDKYTG